MPRSGRPALATGPRRAAAAWGEPRNTSRPSTCADTPLPPSACAASATGMAMASAAARSRMALARGWLEPVSSAAARRSTSASGRAKAITSVTCGFPAVRVPVLSKQTVGDLARRLQHGAALQQQPAPRPGGEAGCDGGRGRDHQRAGAADEEDGKALVDPGIPRPAEQQRRDDRHQRRHHHHAGGCSSARSDRMSRSVGARFSCASSTSFTTRAMVLSSAVAVTPHAQRRLPVHGAGEDGGVGAPCAPARSRRSPGSRRCRSRRRR